MSSEQELLSSTALTIFRLNGQFLTIANDLAGTAGLTATKWQVLGAVLGESLTMAEIARRMGITRQSVQRTTRQLVDDGLVELKTNPAHRTAKLVQPTAKGRVTVAKIDPAHKAFAHLLVDAVSSEKMHEVVDGLAELVETLTDLTKSSSAELGSENTDTI